MRALLDKGVSGLATTSLTTSCYTTGYVQVNWSASTRRGFKPLSGLSEMYPGWLHKLIGLLVIPSGER